MAPPPPPAATPPSAPAFPPLPPFPPFPVEGLGDALVRVQVWEPDRDAPERLRLVRDPDQDRWGAPVFVPRPVSVSAMQEQLERDRSRAAAGHPASYAVVSATGGELLGDVACRLDLPPMGIADVGYATLPEARGRGVASAALALLTRWLMDPLTGPGLERVQLDHAVDNIGSCRVALRAGFEREGVRRHYLPLVDLEAASGQRRADVCLHGRVAVSPR